MHAVGDPLRLRAIATAVRKRPTDGRTYKFCGEARRRERSTRHGACLALPAARRLVRHYSTDFVIRLVRPARPAMKSFDQSTYLIKSAGEDRQRLNALQKNLASLCRHRAICIYIIKRVMSVCLYVANGRPNGWADQDQTWHKDSC